MVIKKAQVQVRKYSPIVILQQICYVILDSLSRGGWCGHPLQQLTDRTDLLCDIVEFATERVQASKQILTKSNNEWDTYIVSRMYLVFGFITAIMQIRQQIHL